MKEIRRTRRSGCSTVLNLTGFLELEEFYEISKEGSTVIIKQIEMKVLEPQKAI